MTGSSSDLIMHYKREFHSHYASLTWGLFIGSWVSKSLAIEQRGPYPFPRHPTSTLSLLVSLYPMRVLTRHLWLRPLRTASGMDPLMQRTPPTCAKYPTGRQLGISCTLQLPCVPT
jgi:hypothetical protein